MNTPLASQHNDRKLEREATTAAHTAGLHSLKQSYGNEKRRLRKEQEGETTAGHAKHSMVLEGLATRFEEQKARCTNKMCEDPGDTKATNNGMSATVEAPGGYVPEVHSFVSVQDPGKADVVGRSSSPLGFGSSQNTTPAAVKERSGNDNEEVLDQLYAADKPQIRRRQDHRTANAASAHSNTLPAPAQKLKSNCSSVTMSLNRYWAQSSRALTICSSLPWIPLH